MFIGPISNPASDLEAKFTKAQEAVRKDVERAFGVLQKRFRIIKTPARLWDVENMELVMKTCLILHNLIIEDEFHIPGAAELADEEWNETHAESATSGPKCEVSYCRLPPLTIPDLLHNYCANADRVRSERKHRKLFDDLLLHHHKLIAQRHGTE
eukprot:CAMPEP_0175904334 /NCGR_PEP_ID=MMETSP0108-20121206/4416_1 /TAXON_ID=195067 ORGANISM="Goniomonas pacifica, Strain CCMP1869" /NCGR_SAMPLE_ID=MMETSP0108 /ASSEMBLY_ACC=CAM_ASM_000204 /LENGTH=154 /DNA_ID=CAMNT_0017226129 /DNA_START=69 /DNA_END=533 /DNA_ORIENTATION=-